MPPPQYQNVFTISSISNSIRMTLKRFVFIYMRETKSERKTKEKKKTMLSTFWHQGNQRLTTFLRVSGQQQFYRTGYIETNEISKWKKQTRKRPHPSSHANRARGMREAMLHETMMVGILTSPAPHVIAQIANRYKISQLNRHFDVEGHCFAVVTFGRSQGIYQVVTLSVRFSLQ